MSDLVCRVCVAHRGEGKGIAKRVRQGGTVECEGLVLEREVDEKVQ